MKTLITLFALFVALNTNAQLNNTAEKFTIEFMGVKVDGPIEQCAQKYVAKGFRVNKRESAFYKLTGMVKSQTVELYLIATPITKKVCRLAVYFPEQISWMSIKSDYKDLKKTIIDKYGDPKDDYNFFSSPYYEGDGYETSAVKIEKCHYAAIWQEEPGPSTTGYNILLQISKWMQVTLQYENAKNMDIKEREDKQLDNQNF